MRETPIVKAIREALARTYKLHTFVNLVGKAWFGKFLDQKDGIVRLLGGRIYPVGLPEGSPDLIGWHSVVVTPKMVGKRISVLVGFEVKQPGKYAKQHQKNFQTLLREQGAICGVVKSPEDALHIIEQWEENNL